MNWGLLFESYGAVFLDPQVLLMTLLGEVFGTAILGGLCAYPVAVCFMGQSAADIAFYAYIIPFLLGKGMPMDVLNVSRSMYVSVWLGTRLVELLGHGICMSSLGRCC